MGGVDIQTEKLRFIPKIYTQSQYDSEPRIVDNYVWAYILTYLPTYTHKSTLKMHFSTLLPITLLAAMAAANPCPGCARSDQYLPGVPAPDSESATYLPGVPAPVTRASASKVCLEICYFGPTECHAGWVRQFSST